MPGGFLMLGALALAAATIGGILLVVLSDASAVERRCWKRVRNAEPLLDTNPEQVRQICERTQKKLKRLAAKQGRRGTGLQTFPDASKGLAAYAWSEVLLSVLDETAGNRQAAVARLKNVRARFTNAVDQRQWLLRYYVLAGTPDASTVKCLMEAISSSESAPLPFSRERIETYLRRICAVQLGMSKEELQQRIHWNHAAQQVLADLCWPWVGEARAWCQLGSLRRAIRVLESARERFAEDRELKLVSANVLRASGDTQGARPLLEELSTDPASGNDILLGVVEQYLEMGEDAAAESVLARVDMTHPSAAEQSVLIRARSLARRGSTDSAVELLEQSGHWQSHENSGVLLAQLYSSRGDYQRALATLCAAIPADTDRPEYEWTMAVAYWNTEDYANAADWFTRCRRSRYRVVEAAQRLAQCLLKQDRRDEAVRILESAQSPTAAAEAAFHRGVLLYEEGRPDQAFPYFVRCQKLAQEHNQETLQRRAGRNGIACYHALAQQRIESGEFEQAATAIQRLMDYHKGNADILARLAKSQAECYVRGALTYLENGAHRDYGTAATLVERALQLRSSDRLRGLLGGLYARQGDFAKAGQVYDQLLVKNPRSNTARFARALCQARINGGEGFVELRECARKRGPYAVRAALAVATDDARQGRYADAVALLHEVLAFPESSQDVFAGQARCQVVLLTLRAGQLERARQLGTQLLGGGRIDPDAILGTLLAHDGDYEMALPHLEAGISSNGQATTGSLILNTVYRRVAAGHCRARQYREATQLLQRAATRDPDPALRQYADLVKMTVAASNGKDTIDDRTLAVMTQTLRSAPGLKGVLLRATAVGHQQLARTRTRSGQHTKARDLWERSFELCNQLRGNAKFWQQYIDNYNVGKQYVLDCDPRELENRVFERIAGLHILMVRELLWSSRPSLADALRHWQAARKIVSQATASELFEELVQVDQLIRHLDPKRNPKTALGMLKWIYKNVEQKEAYQTQLVNLALGTALDSLEKCRVAEFLDNLAIAAEANSDLREALQKLRCLEHDTIRRIVTATAATPVAGTIKTANSEVYRMVLLRVVVAFAMAYSQNAALSTHGELQRMMVPALLNQVLGAVLQSLGSK